MKYLLVEDNHELANAICSRIKLDGHVIDHTDKLEDAIAFSDTGEYDLIYVTAIKMAISCFGLQTVLLRVA